MVEADSLSASVMLCMRYIRSFLEGLFRGLHEVILSTLESLFKKGWKLQGGIEDFHKNVKRVETIE